jgi:outer membrane protein OmpA-like peptidoglycan-associated protein
VPEYNKTLSGYRAEAVANYIVYKGIDSSRIKAKGYGDTQPLETNETAKGRAKNRRVEFTIQF